MKSPRISQALVDWEDAGAELGAIEALKPTDTPAEQLASLSRATGERFAGIAASPVPVLLPFDTAAYLRDRAAAGGAADAGDPTGAPAVNYLAGFQGVPFFYTGPAGYDAVILARAAEMRDLGIGYSQPIYINISGSALLYELGKMRGK